MTNLSKVTVTVVDYGVGNLLSVSRAIEFCGAKVKLTNTPKEIISATHLILPGVGAFGDGMAGLRNLKLVEPIKELAASGRHFLGICLGMQMMFDESEEFGKHAGLGLIPGSVKGIPSTTINELPHKIPHIGWSPLQMPSPKSNWEGTILSGIKPGDSTYFVHSFVAHPIDPRHTLSNCSYNGRIITAVIKKDHLYGCQFHPEKSGPIGLSIIKAFCTL